MSTLQNQSWPNPIQKETLDSKYEKCRNITEEIYKRINITFQIKKLETTAECDASEHSDQIDSNELSYETDLFACDKTDSLPSSTEGEKIADVACEKLADVACDKLTNINNNNIKKTVYKRPKKKFRKRVKKRQPSKQSESDGSSDEALPLSRMVGVEPRRSPPCVMGVPNIVILTKDNKPKIIAPEKQKQSKETKANKKETKASPAIDKVTAQEIRDKIEPVFAEAIEKATAMLDFSVVGKADLKTCGLCELSFHGAKGLRHHMAVSHITSPRERRSAQRSKEEKRV